MKLCIFSNDPIKTYFEKGEIKERYFNPNNIFDHIDVISLTERDIEEHKVKALFGTASFKIHSVGKIGIRKINAKKDKILKLVREIDPDVIRTYNTLTEGWLAAYCSEKLNIPLFVSVHIQYDNLRKQYKISDIRRYLKLKYSEKRIEPYVLKTATKITAVYKIIDSYVARLSGKHAEIIYNKIDYDRFANAMPCLQFDKPLIISVGRLTRQKHHDVVIRAMRDVDAYLLIIGDGELRNELQSLVKKLKLDKKVIFKKSVPNSEIHHYYKSAQVFALAYDTKVEGIPIPIMEAMAAGLPIVIPHPPKGISDRLDDVAKFVDPNSDTVTKAINELLSDKAMYQELAKKSKIKAKEFDAQLISDKEAMIYISLVNRVTDS